MCREVEYFFFHYKSTNFLFFYVFLQVKQRGALTLTAESPTHTATRSVPPLTHSPLKTDFMCDLVPRFSGVLGAHAQC